MTINEKYYKQREELEKQVKEELQAEVDKMRRLVDLKRREKKVKNYKNSTAVILADGFHIPDLNIPELELLTKLIDNIEYLENEEGEKSNYTIQIYDKTGTKDKGIKTMMTFEDLSPAEWVAFDNLYNLNYIREVGSIILLPKVFEYIRDKHTKIGILPKDFKKTPQAALVGSFIREASAMLTGEPFKNDEYVVMISEQAIMRFLNINSERVADCVEEYYGDSFVYEGFRRKKGYEFDRRYWIDTKNSIIIEKHVEI